jgi:hypothetical protein
VNYFVGLLWGYFMHKKKDIGNGLRLTISDDMGVFLHCQTAEGKAAGMCLSGKFPEAFEAWALEQLADVPDEENA